MPKRRVPIETEKKPADGGTSESRGEIDNTYPDINSTTNSPENQEQISSKAMRTKVFATIVYPESAPADWETILSDTHVPAFVSPLHDKDVNPDGQQKKPHYHVMLVFDSLKNFDTQVKPIFDRIGGVGREEVLSQRGYARYLCHMDNPEKYQYEQAEVTELNGASYSATIMLPTDEIGAVRDMLVFIEDNDIYSFRKLLDWCASNKEDWFRLLLSSKTYIIKEYLKSRYWDLENGPKLDALSHARRDRQKGRIDNYDVQDDCEEP